MIIKLSNICSSSKKSLLEKCKFILSLHKYLLKTYMPGTGFGPIDISFDYGI